MHPRRESSVVVVLDCAVAFELESNYKPRGDQSQAIAKLLKSITFAIVKVLPEPVTPSSV